VLKDALHRLAGGTSLSADEAADATGQIMDGAATPAQIAAFLTALHLKGETVEEITGCARAMRQRMIRVEGGPGVLVDTCGTGGDGRGTFNISTLSAIVISACGVRVAKHGNRSASSKCGSSDLLEALGVNLEIPKEKAERMLRDVGFAYLHAPHFHPAMKHAGPVRKELGFRTIFNILGPLCNPASANVQIVGIFSPALCRPIAEVLRGLGSTRVFAFHGHGGLDELSTSGENYVVELNEGTIRELTIAAETAGIHEKSTASDLAGGSPQDNARIARELLADGRGPHQTAVVLNAALALLAAGTVPSLKEGARRASEAIRLGQARKKLDQIIEAAR
jgi:anthranilate phosphoribosyltransferase